MASTVIKLEKPSTNSKKSKKSKKGKGPKTPKKKGPIIISQDISLSSSESSEDSDRGSHEQGMTEEYLDHRFRCFPRTGQITPVSLQRGEFIPQVTVLSAPKHIRVIDGTSVPDFDYNQVINHFYRVGNTVSFSGSVTLRVSKKCGSKGWEPSGMISFSLKVPVAGVITASGMVTTLWVSDHKDGTPLSYGVGFIKTSSNNPDTVLLASMIPSDFKLGGSWCTFSYHVDYTLTPGS